MTHATAQHPRPSGATPEEAACAAASRPFVLAATIIASAMAFIDGAIVTIALPSLQAEFDASLGAMQWVVNAYMLMLGALILVGGAAGDRFGRRLMFLIGASVFGVASVACALAPSAEALIAARAAQGVGAALLVPQSLAILSASYPRETRGRAIGVWAGASAVSTAMGPALGGFLIDALDWRAAFWINVPLVVAVIALTLRHVPETRDETARGALDWPGAFAAVVGFGLLTLGFGGEGGEAGLSPIALLGGVGLLGLFVVIERRASAPLTPPTLFADRSFVAANVATVLLYGAFTATLFLLPYDLITRRGMTAAEVGLSMSVIGLIIGVSSGAAGAWADRVGARAPLTLGALIVGVAILWLGATLDDFWVGVMGPIVLMSLGMACVAAPLSAAVMNAAPDHLAGAASGVSNAASRVAGLLAVAIATLVAESLWRVRAGSLEQPLRAFGAPFSADPAAAALEAAFIESFSVTVTLAAFPAFLAAIAARWVARKT